MRHETDNPALSKRVASDWCPADRNQFLMDRVSYHLQRLLPFPFRIGLEYESLTEAPAATIAKQLERGEIDSPGAPPPTLDRGLEEEPLDLPAPMTFEVQNVTGIFSRSEELCLGVKGISTWCIVFQRDDEQRILDCSRLLDVIFFKNIVRI